MRRAAFFFDSRYGTLSISRQPQQQKKIIATEAQHPARSTRIRTILGCAFALAALASPSAAPAQGKAATTPVSRWLLKISGITAAAGEDASSMSWGASRSGTLSALDMNVTLANEAPSWVLLSQALFAGTHFATATLEYYEPPGTLAFRYTLTDVTVTSLQLRGSPVDLASAQWSFNYSKITLTDIAAGTRTCFDILANRSC